MQRPSLLPKHSCTSAQVKGVCAVQRRLKATQNCGTISVGGLHHGRMSLTGAVDLRQRPEAKAMTPVESRGPWPMFIIMAGLECRQTLPCTLVTQYRASVLNWRNIWFSKHACRVAVSSVISYVQLFAYCLIGCHTEEQNLAFASFYLFSCARVVVRSVGQSMPWLAGGPLGPAGPAGCRALSLGLPLVRRVCQKCQSRLQIRQGKRQVDWSASRPVNSPTGSALKTRLKRSTVEYS